MHYHNLFLVQAEDAIKAIGKVKTFLDKLISDEGPLDWYQIGGRYMWSDLVKKNMDKIVDKKGFYKAEGIELDYALKRQVNTSPEETEAIDATHPEFAKRIGEGQDTRYSEIGRMLSYSKNPGKNTSMVKWWVERANRLAEAKEWDPDMYFWNLSNPDKPTEIDHKSIEASPKQWFLVNTDVHS